MPTYLKTKPAWLQLVVFGGIAMGTAILSSLIGPPIVASVNHISILELTRLSTTDFALPQYAGVAKGMLVVQFFGLFLLPSLVFAWFADPRPLVFAGIKKPDRLNFIFIGLIIILCSYLMVEWLSEINQVIVRNLAGKKTRAWIEKGESDVGGTLQNILAMKNITDLLISIFLVAVLASVGEELFFRGILQRIFIQAFRSPFWGILVTAAIFSAAHGQFLGFLPRMILGMVLGALYWYSGSLLPAIVGHFVFNGLQVVLVYYHVIDTSESGNMTGSHLIWVGLMAMVAVILLLNYMRKRSRTTFEKIYPPDQERLPES